MPEELPNNYKPSFIKVHDDEFHIGDLMLSRETFAHHGGMLEHDICVVEGDQVLVGSTWQVHPKGSYDGAIAALDKHWEHVKGEFDTLIQDAGGYHTIKSQMPARQHAMLRGAICRVGTLLLGQPMSDERLISGKEDPDSYPLVHTADAMKGIRDTAASKGMKLGIKFDGYEQKLRKLERELERAGDTYEAITMSGMEDGYQATVDESDEEDWRGDVHHVAEGHESLESWQDLDHDVDDVRDLKTDALLHKFEDHVRNFSSFANRIWMSAAMHVSQGQAYSGNELFITNMREAFASAKVAYSQIKDQMRDSGIAQYELKPFFHAIEDKVIPSMQEIMSFASRPKHLEEAVKKRMPPNREI